MKQFFATMDKLRPIYDMTDKIVMTICKLLLIADIIITGYSYWAGISRSSPRRPGRRRLS